MTLADLIARVEGWVQPHRFSVRDRMYLWFAIGVALARGESIAWVFVPAAVFYQIKNGTIRTGTVTKSGKERFVPLAHRSAQAARDTRTAVKVL